MYDIMQHLTNATNVSEEANSNCDRLEALTLHYLCVLAKDTELREPMSKYYNEVMMAAIKHIDDTDWTVCNAALQLFGALIPKLVGQRQATEFEELLEWEASELTYDEINNQLPKISAYILEYCLNQATNAKANRSIILFLGFLTKVEHLHKFAGRVDDKNLSSFRALHMSLLGHSCEKIRHLAAICFVRSHEFRCDLPQIMLQILQFMFTIENENFFQGLCMVLLFGWDKWQHESQHTISAIETEKFKHNLYLGFSSNFKLNLNFKPYSFCKLLDLLRRLQFKSNDVILKQLLGLKGQNLNSNWIGFDVFLQKIDLFCN